MFCFFWSEHKSTPPFFPAQDRGKILGDMLAVVDTGIGNLTDAMRARGMWASTLLLVTSDNGGIGPGNNFPLRGHKMEPWEGG